MADDFYVDIMEPKQDPNASAELMSRVLAPLYQKCWLEEQEKEYGKPFDLHVQLLLNLWFTGGAKFFLARELAGEQKAIGFLAGLVYRPLQYNAHVFQVQEWYSSGRADVEKALFDQALNAVRFIGCDEFWVSSPGKPLPEFGKAWRKENEFIIQRFIKAE